MSSSLPKVSFVNINLEEFTSEDKILSQNEDKTKELDEHSSTEPTVLERPNFTLLNHLSTQFTNDYEDYFQLNVHNHKQFEELNDTIDNLLTHMEEFYGLIEMLRNESSHMEKLSTSLDSKINQMKDMFRMIDKLESIVNIVSCNLNSMEREVGKAESMIVSRKNPVRKLFSLISNSNKIFSRYQYNPPIIFKTEDLLK